MKNKHYYIIRVNGTDIAVLENPEDCRIAVEQIEADCGEASSVNLNNLTTTYNFTYKPKQ